MKERAIPPRGPLKGRRAAGHAQEPDVIDPYKETHKLPDPTVCPRCGAVFHEGRWAWGAHPPAAAEHPCPACHRIHDKFPAGVVTLEGSYLAGHRDEILHLVRNLESAEKQDHPLGRIMNIEQEGGRIIINTTDIHLPRRIGDRLAHAFHGKLDFHYNEDDYFIRVFWTKEA